MNKGYGQINSYLHATQHSEEYPIYCDAMIHSSLGEYTIGNLYKSGGHGQEAIDYMNANGIRYEINIEYENGVRAGNIIDSKNKKFRSGNNHTWFPSNWTNSDIRHAGEYVASQIRGVPVEGQHYVSEYRGVNVAVIYRNGKITTIFPKI